MKATQISSLGPEDPLEKEMATSFSSCLRSFPASGSFPMSHFFTSGGQSIGVSALHQSFNEYSGLISFRIHWFALPAVQGILKSHLQHHSSKTSILWCSAFFMVQCSFLGNLMDREAYQATVHGVTRVGNDLATKPPSPTTNC